MWERLEQSLSIFINLSKLEQASESTVKDEEESDSDYDVDPDDNDDDSDVDPDDNDDDSDVDPDDNDDDSDVDPDDRDDSDFDFESDFDFYGAGARINLLRMLSSGASQSFLRERRFE